MRGAVKNYVFGQKWEPNTIIGGIGSVITTKSALATKLGISESIIRGFKVVGSDVYCRITSYYQIPVNCFRDDTTITYYYDYDSNVTLSSASFQGSTIKKAIFNRHTTIPSFCFQNSMLEELEARNANLLASNALDNTPIHTIDAPYLVNFLTYSVRNTPNLVNVNFRPVEIGLGAFWFSSVILDLSNTTSVHNRGLGYGIYVNLNMPSIITFSWTAPINNMTLCENAYLDELVSIGDSQNFFSNWPSANLIRMKKLKTYGTYASGGGTAADYGFSNLKTGCLIQVHEDLATANAGAPHEAFLWVKANRGATVEFYDDSGNYVSTL